MLSKSTIKNSNDRKNTLSLSVRSTKLTGNKLASLCLQNKTQCIGFYSRTYKKSTLHTGFIYIYIYIYMYIILYTVNLKDTITRYLKL